MTNRQIVVIVDFQSFARRLFVSVALVARIRRIRSLIKGILGLPFLTPARRADMLYKRTCGLNVLKIMDIFNVLH